MPNTMKAIRLFTLSAAASLDAAPGGPNSDPPITWTIYSGYQPVTINNVTVIQSCTPGIGGCISSAVTGDNNGPYVSGQGGVTNCVIHFSSGTYDATLGFTNGSARTIGFNLAEQLAYNAAATQPSWATQTIGGGGFLNVSHILFPTTALGSTLEDDYTTRFTSQLPVKGSYHLRMNSDNPVPDAGPQGAGSTQMPPMTLTALGQTGADATQVATLVGVTTHGTNTLTTVAQYSLPFFFKIELK